MTPAFRPWGYAARLLYDELAAGVDPLGGGTSWCLPRAP